MIYKTEDRKIFDSLLQSSLEEHWELLPHAELILKVGKYFLNTPYSESTLETKDTEHLVINFRQMDCFTFIENVTAQTILMKNKNPSFDEYAAILQKVRYRGGVLHGYSSRLHYFSDWLYDNQLKGFVKDITARIGGEIYKKEINFMTKNPGQYPPMEIISQYKEMLTVEENLQRRSLHRILKQDLQRCAAKIKNCDLIAITTNKAGLDVMHAGIVLSLKEKLYLLHASKAEGKVVVSGQTLDEYLEEKEERTGIIVARIL